LTGIEVSRCLTATTMAGAKSAAAGAATGMAAEKWMGAVRSVCTFPTASKLVSETGQKPACSKQEEQQERRRQHRHNNIRKARVLKAPAENTTAVQCQSP